jgi:hypothetical protein
MSIAEVALAIAVIGVGLVALSSAIPLTSYGIREGDQLSTATFLANERLEQVRNARWEVGPPALDTLGNSPVATAAPVSGGVVTFPDESPVAAPHAGYSRTVRVTDCGVGVGCGGIASPDMRQVTVTVTYRPMTSAGVAPAGTTKPATVTMYVAKR